jgi:hypothetical protein
MWLRIGLLLGAYAVFILLLETKIGQFLATLDDATPLDESPLFSRNFGLLGRVILAFVVLILPAMTGVLVGEWREKPKDA